MSRTLATMALLGLLALLTGCGGGAEASVGGSQGSMGSPTAPVAGEVRVELKNLQFQPRELTVRAGSRITFINQDTMLHDVVQTTPRRVGKEQPGFASPVLAQGESWSITLTEPGTYPVLCAQAAHYTAGMVGTIKVVP